MPDIAPAAAVEKDTLHMQKELQQGFEAVTAMLRAMLDSFHRSDDRALNTPMQEGKWSAAQTTWHVIRAMEVSLDYLEYKLAQPHRFSRAGIGSWVRGRLLVGFLNSDRKFKAPAVTASVPEQIPLAELHRFADAQIERLRVLLGSFPQQLHHKTVFKHPVAGRLTIRQMLAFMQAHTFHHKKQTDLYLSQLTAH